jgi:hypothetical protein
MPDEGKIKGNKRGRGFSRYELNGVDSGNETRGGRFGLACI